jgi:Bacterial virulence protein (VirJ)
MTHARDVRAGPGGSGQPSRRPAGLRGAWVAALLLAASIATTGMAGAPAAAPAAPPAPATPAAPVATPTATSTPVPTPAAPTPIAVETSRGRIDLVVYAAASQPAATATAAPAPRPRPLVLLVSGEGGWARFVDLVASALAADGFWVGGIDVKKYFADPQDDREALAADLRRFGNALAKTAGREGPAPLILGGYSFGADIAPWAAAAGGWNGRLHGLLMIAPDQTGSLQYRFTEMLGIQYKEHVFPVADAVETVAGLPILFVHGDGDSGSATPALARAALEPKKLLLVPDAGHHFSGHEGQFRQALRDGMNWLCGASPAGGAGR